MLGYGKPDITFENEKKDFAKFALNNFDGNYLREYGPAVDYFNYQLVTNTPKQFKQYKIDDILKEAEFDAVFIPGNSVKELVKSGEQFELKYIIVNKDGNQPFHVFLADLYLNEENYPYMIKVFDSTELGYKKFKVKVFEIDYEKFNKINE